MQRLLSKLVAGASDRITKRRQRRRGAAVVMAMSAKQNRVQKQNQQLQQDGGEAAEDEAMRLDALAAAAAEAADIQQLHQREQQKPRQQRRLRSQTTAAPVPTLARQPRRRLLSSDALPRHRLRSAYGARTIAAARVQQRPYAETGTAVAEGRTTTQREQRGASVSFRARSGGGAANHKKAGRAKKKALLKRATLVAVEGKPMATAATTLSETAASWGAPIASRVPTLPSALFVAATRSTTPAATPAPAPAPAPASAFTRLVPLAVDTGAPKSVVPTAASAAVLVPVADAAIQSPAVEVAATAPTAQQTLEAPAALPATAAPALAVGLSTDMYDDDDWDDGEDVGSHSSDIEHSGSADGGGGSEDDDDDNSYNDDSYDDEDEDDDDEGEGEDADDDGDEENGGGNVNDNGSCRDEHDGASDCKFVPRGAWAAAEAAIDAAAARVERSRQDDDSLSPSGKPKFSKVTAPLAIVRGTVSMKKKTPSAVDIAAKATLRRKKARARAAATREKKAQAMVAQLDSRKSGKTVAAALLADGKVDDVLFL